MDACDRQGGHLSIVVSSCYSSRLKELHILNNPPDLTSKKKKERDLQFGGLDVHQVLWTIRFLGNGHRKHPTIDRCPLYRCCRTIVKDT